MSIFVKTHKKKGSSRSQIDIESVQNNVLKLPGGHYRTIYRLSSVNFELMSEDEQDSLIDSYKSFLNSLQGSIQILVRIREIDLDQYLESFDRLTSTEKEPVYVDQAERYRRFVSKLVSSKKILRREFYAVLSYGDKTVDQQHAYDQLKLSEQVMRRGLRKIGVVP